MRAVLVAGGVGIFVTLLGTPVAIRILARRGYGQVIRDDGPVTHQVKRGTPTMGGVVIVLAALLAYLVAHLVWWHAPSASALLVLLLAVSLGLVGFLDDYIKVSRQRSLGLRAAAKFTGQLAAGIAFAVLALNFPDSRGVTPGSRYISFATDLRALHLPAAVFVVWVLLIIAATSNGVNLTDGLDGLATGASSMVFGAYVAISLWQFDQACFKQPGPKCYEVRDPYDLAVLAAAFLGACFGFLWWNASPAKIIMGDTGALSLGGALAGLAVMSRTELLLVVLGGLFVIEAVSDILQIGVFKFYRITTGQGRRIFRMAPLHHHFELKGWQEITIVIRFWILCGIFVVAGVGIFYGSWLVGS